MKPESILIGILILLWVVVGFSIVVLIHEVNNTQLEEPCTVVQKSITEGCYGLDIFDTSRCLQKNIQCFHEYNLDNAGKNLSFEELKQQGGVCSHYSSLYYQASKDLGFYSREVIIAIEPPIGHIFTVISNKEGYCLLDQLDVQCFQK